MNVIEFTIPGIPKGKGRPRFAVRGRFARAYTPEKTRVLEQTIAARAMEWRPASPLTGPIALQLLFVFPIPASWSKKRRAQVARLHMAHVGKPDADNCVKAVLDALNGVYFRDDAQVCQLTVRKQYGDEPRTVVSVWEFEEQEEAV